jgi:predicted transcriptional regulator
MRARKCRRERLEIAKDILKEAVGGCRKTHIMYSCNLSFTQNNEYLQELSALGLLSLTSDGQYVTTPKGVNAIKTAENAIKTFSGLYKNLTYKVT